MWAEVVAGPPNLLFYKKQHSTYCDIFTFEYDHRYMVNLNFLYKIIIVYYITIS